MTESVDLGPRSPQTAAEWENYFDLRWRVLRAPWDQPRGSEKDDREDESEHFMIAGPDSRPLAVGRLHFNTRLKPRCVSWPSTRQVRGRGLGSLILRGMRTPGPSRRARPRSFSMLVTMSRDFMSAMDSSSSDRPKRCSPRLNTFGCEKISEPPWFARSRRVRISSISSVGPRYFHPFSDEQRTPTKSRRWSRRGDLRA